ncbi:MAG: hypothetical protein ACOX20_09260 [Limnochordia bacterium]
MEEAAEILAARDLRLDVDKRVFDDESPGESHRFPKPSGQSAS